LTATSDTPLRRWKSTQAGAKNRFHATLAKYGITIEGASDAFGKRRLQELESNHQAEFHGQARG